MKEDFLILDHNWVPHQWVDFEKAINYEVDGQVIDRLGEEIRVFRGGTNALTGLRSELITSSILVIKNGPKGMEYRSPMLTNQALFLRDQQLCAYCGKVYSFLNLTRDHIVPRSKGGPDTWLNVVTACKACNNLKDNIMPGEKLAYKQVGPQGDGFMNPLYVPYAPCKAECMILRNRYIRQDQMELLLSRVKNRQSRIHDTVKALSRQGYFKRVDFGLLALA